MPLSNEDKALLKIEIMKKVRQALHDEALLVNTFAVSGFVNNIEKHEKKIEPGEFQRAMNNLDHPDTKVKYKIDVESRLGNSLVEVLGYTKEEISHMSTSTKACYESILYVANFVAYDAFHRNIPPEEISKETINLAKGEAYALIQEMRQEIKKEIMIGNKRMEVYQELGLLKEKSSAKALYDSLLSAADRFYSSRQTNHDKAVFHQDCIEALDLADKLGEHRGLKKHVSQFLRKIGQTFDIQAIKEQSEKIANSPTKSIEITHRFKDLVHAITRPPTTPTENKESESGHSIH